MCSQLIQIIACIPDKKKSINILFDAIVYQLGEPVLQYAYTIKKSNYVKKKN